MHSKILAVLFISLTFINSNIALPFPQSAFPPTVLGMNPSNPTSPIMVTVPLVVSVLPTGIPIPGVAATLRPESIPGKSILGGTAVHISRILGDIISSGTDFFSQAASGIGMKNIGKLIAGIGERTSDAMGRLGGFAGTVADHIPLIG